MIPVTIPEILRALKILDPSTREEILAAAKDEPQDPSVPPMLIPMWKGQRRYDSAFGKLNQLTPEARKALDGLPDNLRLPLLRQLQGRTQEEIAAELGIKQQVAQGRQKRAKDAIQRILWNGGAPVSRMNTFWRHRRLSPEQMEVIGVLLPRQQLVIRMALQGASSDQIAEVIGRAPMQVPNLANHAYKRLTEIVANKGKYFNETGRQRHRAAMQERARRSRRHTP